MALIAALIVAVPFLIWDFVFTENGFWGFNADYILGFYVFNLPIEEILFFLAIPFACTFTYEVIRYYFREYNLTAFNRIFYFVVPLYAIVLVTIGTPGYYTLGAIVGSMLVLLWLIYNNSMHHLPLAFLFTLIPFIIVNGILTGAITEIPVVWYSEDQIVGPRIFTIPMEDILYSFTMLMANMILYEKLQKKFSK